MPADTAGIEGEPAEAEAAVDMDTATVQGVTWYLVESEAHLRAIGTGEYGLDGNYMQNADITLSRTEWEPIGTETDPFTGQYNGNGYEIRGLTMTSPTVKTVGFFGFAENAQLCIIKEKGKFFHWNCKNVDSTDNVCGLFVTAGVGAMPADTAKAADCNIHSNEVYSIYD